MRRAGFAVAVVAVFAALPAAASARGFTYGVTAADVGSSSALIWTRADKAGKLTLQVDSRRRFSSARTFKAKAAGSADHTVTVKVKRLKPGTVYFYRFTQGRNRSETGRFKTAPNPNKTQTLTFAYSGDADAQRAPGQSKPFWNTFQVYKQMAEEGNDFNVNLGDTIYSDTEVAASTAGGVFTPAAPTALTLAQKWAKYKQNLAMKNLQLVRRSTSMYNEWDDHEFVNDFTNAEHGTSLYRTGVKAFLDYMPASYTSRDGLYRSFRWGKNAEVFFLDERSFRSAKASANHACDNPQTHQPDLAPTAPQRVRNVFSLIVPSLAQPVSAQCLATIRDPNRTMLGTRQLARFESAVKRSKATFKIVMNEVPVQQFYALPYDRWEGYEADRQRLLTFLQQNVKNVVFLTTDTHANLFGDARLQTLEDGGVKDSGVFEGVTGPVATKTSDKEFDEAVGKPGSGELVRSLFYKPQPPNGLGLQCAATNVFSYTEVKVTRNALTLTPKDLNGKLVHEPGQNGQPGPACGPFTLKRK